MQINYQQNFATIDEITNHFSQCDLNFLNKLTSKINLIDYCKKIHSKAFRFEAKSDNLLVGLVAVYCNDVTKKTAFITNVSVLPKWQGQKIAQTLLAQCISHVTQIGMKELTLEVDAKNIAALELYKKNGFILVKNDNQSIEMCLNLERKNMTNTRDYNLEIKDANEHQYAYSFDFDVIHPYMIKSFLPFFKEGNMLELGSFKGDFTKRLQEYFKDITCIEASSVAIEDARKKIDSNIKILNSKFEDVKLDKKYNNIVLTHVLEHLDDPINTLKRVNEEWLADEGRFFLVCPNANAPSRQIAVKMGLISHNSAVTEAELQHGHRCTYTLDTLERDAKLAGLNVVFRSGIFFKALANFQWDRLLQTDIISKEYLEGCFKLGQQYPDLCSSIFLMCEKGGKK